MTWVVDEQTVEPFRIAAIRRPITFGVDDLGSIIGELYGKAFADLPPDAATRGGRNVIAYVPVGDRTADMWVGFEWTGEVPPHLEGFHIPGGRTAHTAHVGPYEALPAAHQAIHAWLDANGQSEVGLNWDLYGDWNDDPAQRVTDVYYLRLTS